jgi:TPR repeat protein
MSEYANADFGRFRFFRDANENLVSFDAQAFGEKVFPVLDLQHLQLARLHVYDQAAKKYDWLQAFQKEMDLLTKIDSRLVARPLDWGRDEDELYYVNRLLDGEDLPAYLSREGAQSPQLAAKWLLPFIDLIAREKEALPMSIVRFSNRNLQVVRTLETNVPELYFTEFTAWTKPGNLVVERGPDHFLGQSFLSLISGIPIRDFTVESLPRQFADLPQSIQKTIIETFGSAPGEVEERFFNEIRKIAHQRKVHPVGNFPRSQIRKWIISEIPNLANAQDIPALGVAALPDLETSYTVETRTDDLESAIQFTPGTATIPRTGWMEQHWLAIRRQGRNFTNQLAVYGVAEGKALTLITEELANGLHLQRLIREIGPQDIEHTVGMATRLSSALDGLEASATAAPVWWLPEQNIYVNLGTRNPADFIEALTTEGSDFWSRVPFRLRLHQTMMNLLEGVYLPESLKRMAFALAKENPHIRRTAVLLPLVGLMLSGKKFAWDQPFTLDLEDTPDGLVKFINTTRQQLISNPYRVEMGFLTKLGSFIEVWDHQTYEEETSTVRDEEDDAVTTHTPLALTQTPAPLMPEERRNRKNSEVAELQKRLSQSLGHDTIDLTAPLEQDEKIYSFLDPRNQPTPNENDFDPESPAPPSPDEPYREGFSMNPIAADVAKKAREEKIARKIATVKRNAQKDADRKKNARELLGLEDRKKAALDNEGHSLMGWLWVIITGLIISGGVGYYLHGKVTQAGVHETIHIEFPLTHYDPVTPRVNPFTNVIYPTRLSEPAHPISVETGVTDFQTAIANSKSAVAEKKFTKAVNLGLWGIQLAADSIEAGTQLEDALVKWIESGISAPSRTADPNTVALLAEYYIADRQNQISEGLYILMGSAKNGNAEAMRIFGLLFGQGKLVPRSPSIANRWLQEAAKKGDRDAQFYYGESSVYGTMIVQNSEGYSFLERAADAGHPRSLLFRGFCCLEGLGGTKNPKTGYEYVARAAEKGSLEALFQMGLCRANGYGTEQSDKAAASSFKTAADLGCVPAMFRYGQCLFVGYGTTQSFSDCVSWMKKAAADGHFEAQNWCSQYRAQFEPVAEK